MLEIVRVLEQRHYTSQGKAMLDALALCSTCGQISNILVQNVKKHNRLGRTHCQHCIQDKFHRMTHTRIWRIWQGLRWRANDPTDKNYGGRGITVCEEWQRDFNAFYADMSEGYSDDLTIERIDVNKPYCKENCRWATNMEQQANKRNNRKMPFHGEMIHLAELCRRSGFSKSMLSMRLNRGMSAEEAVRDAQMSPYGKGPRAVKRRMSTT